MLRRGASYRQNVHAYPSGGGDYEVATVNLGPHVGLDGGQRAARRLHADGGGVGRLRGGEHRLGGPVRRRATRCSVAVGRRRAADGDEPARHPRVRRRRSPSRPTRSWSAIIGMIAAAGVFRMFVLGDDLQAPRAPSYRSSPSRATTLTGFALRLPAAARVLLRLRRADRRRGDHQRRAGVPQAQEQERRDHAAAAGRARGHHVRRDHRAGLAAPASSSPTRPPRPRRASPVPAGRLRPEDGHRPDRRGGLRQLPARLLLRRRGHRR